jgi:hypothetical protein
MRNKKLKGPQGLTGGKLGSWRHGEMLKLQAKKSKKSLEEHCKRMVIERKESAQKEREKLKDTFIFIQNDCNYTYKYNCWVEYVSVLQLKSYIVGKLALANISTSHGVLDIEVFYPYCKLVRDDTATLAALGLTDGDMIHYRIKPGVTLYVP